MLDAEISRRELLGAAAGAAAAASLPSTARADGARHRRRVDVAVVGAGLAGLTAARELVHRGYSVRVLEARGRVGGATLNHPLGAGRVSEVGGQFVGPTQDRVLALARSLGIRTFPTYDRGRNVYFKSGERSFFEDRPPLGSVPPDPDILPDLARGAGSLDTLSREIPLDAPWTASRAAEWDAQTLDSWLAATVRNRTARTLFHAVARSLWGAEPRDISLLYALFYVGAAGDARHPGTFERLLDVRGGAQARRFVGGSQRLSLELARRLGSRIVLRAPVRRIEHGRGGVVVVCDRDRLHARRVVVTAPPALAGRIEYDPALPFLRDQLTQRVPQGTLMKVAAVYERPWWRDLELTGQVVSDTGPLFLTYDTSPPGGRPGVLFGFIGGHDARVWGRRSLRARRARVLEQLGQYFGDRARHPSGYFEKNWASDPWSRGCPTATFPPGLLLDFGPALRAPVGRVHWAGTSTATRWNGYMDGAVRSGERIAREVAARL
jgi:monoamine oxidase